MFEFIFAVVAFLMATMFILRTYPLSTKQSALPTSAVRASDILLREGYMAAPRTRRRLAVA